MIFFLFYELMVSIEASTTETFGVTSNFSHLLPSAPKEAPVPL